MGEKEREGVDKGMHGLRVSWAGNSMDLEYQNGDEGHRLTHIMHAVAVHVGTKKNEN
jgi:hypothetical protein